MKAERWVRIIPVALIMYTISYVDRTNVSLALDPGLSTMMRDLGMDDKMKGNAAGIFFFGYVLLQIPGGYLASHWSARKVISIFLVLWGICAVGCGMVSTFSQFQVMRFLLGVAESGVYPATLVLLASWFPRAERARANACWNLCQPLSVAFSAPLTAWMLGSWGWQKMIMIEGALPFIWLPIWLYFISDHPRQAKWISAGERDYLETTLKAEAAASNPVKPAPIWEAFLQPTVLVMLVIYFLHNCAAYGCMTFLTEGLKGSGRKPSGLEFGILFAIPYIVTACIMVINSWHSDKTGERRGHVAVVYVMSGLSLILSVQVKEYSFWLSYVFLCLAIPGPFAALAPFWAIPSETMPRRVMGSVMGLVNAIGNLGGFLGPFIVGALKKQTNGVAIPFSMLGVFLLMAAGLAFLLPNTKTAPIRK
ncbi:MAG TPA: MFS transporter [Verrucomicrobiae bacterium]|nr:MFS transporter [Verrucomicrobiae bacterium]